MKKSIAITVTPNGDIQIEALGYQGKGCEAATQAIEAALGAVRGRQKKAEYHQPVAASHTQRA